MSKKLLTALSTGMVLVSLMFLILAAPAYAATSSLEHLITLDDLPSGFVTASEAEVENCPGGGGQDIFVLREEAQIIESICVSSFSLTAAIDNEGGVEMTQSFFDAILQHPEELLKQAKPEDIAGVEILVNLPILGDTAAGFTKAEGVTRSDFAIFRRGDTINSVVVSYTSGKAPVIALQDVASKLDTRVAAVFEPQVAQVDALEPVSQTQAATQSHMLIAQVGEVIDQGAYSLTINTMEEGQTYNAYVQPNLGNHYVAVDLTVSSKADEGVSINEFNAVLKDAEGYQYKPTFAGKDPQLGTESNLPAGDKARGWITFEVPDTAKGLTFEYRPLNLKRAIRVALS